MPALTWSARKAATVAGLAGVGQRRCSAHHAEKPALSIASRRRQPEQVTMSRPISRFSGDASARSFPDAATVYQEWASRQLKLAVEDASYAISTGEALMDMGSRLLDGEDKGKGSIVST
jgi:hypothetical protein